MSNSPEHATEPQTVPTPMYVPTTIRAKRDRVLVRYPATALLVLAMAGIGALPVAIGLAPWGLLIYLPLIVLAVLVLRVGADITDDEVRIKGPFYTRVVPRTDIAGLAVHGEKRVHLMRQDGSTIEVPTLRPRDLPTLRAVLFDALENS